MAQSWKKKDREQKKQKEKNDKAEKMQHRKEKPKKSFDDMIAYMDENGNLSSAPPDPRKKTEIKLEDIQIGVPEYVPPTEEELTRTGKVTFFNTTKGFGFIKDLVSQQSVFVHVNNLESPIQENDKVSFQIEMGQRGPAAVKVRLVNNISK
jgi:cold shock CspA family protein